MAKIYNIDSSNIDINPKEVLRYLGYSILGIDESNIEYAVSKIEKARINIVSRVCYDRFEICVNEDGHIALPYGNIYSKDLAVNLRGCEEIFLFAATLGNEYDRAMRRAKVSSIADAACYQAVGAAAIEDICDKLMNQLSEAVRAEGKQLKPRYSPGFGDFGLENQKGIFKVLQPENKIGLTLMDTLIMAPEKSVTAVIGIETL